VLPSANGNASFPGARNLSSSILPVTVAGAAILMNGRTLRVDHGQAASRHDMLAASI
jgi:hypothetical protein